MLVKDKNRKNILSIIKTCNVQRYSMFFLLGNIKSLHYSRLSQYYCIASQAMCRLYYAHIHTQRAPFAILGELSHTISMGRCEDNRLVAHIINEMNPQTFSLFSLGGESLYEFLIPIYFWLTLSYVGLVAYTF